MKTTIIVTAALAGLVSVHAAPRTNALESYSVAVSVQRSIVSELASQIETNTVYSVLYPDVTAVLSRLDDLIDSVTEAAATNPTASAAVSRHMASLSAVYSQLTAPTTITLPTGAVASNDLPIASAFLAAITASGGLFDIPADPSATTPDTPTSTTVNVVNPTTSNAARPTAGVEVGMIGAAAAAGLFGLAALL